MAGLQRGNARKHMIHDMTNKIIRVTTIRYWSMEESKTAMK